LGSSLRGRPVWIVGAVIVVLVAAVGYVWLAQWSGDVVDRELAPGASVTTRSGLTFTLPSGWSGRYVRYAVLPAWFPYGQSANGPNEPQLSEQLIAAPTSSSDPSRVIAMSYTRNDPYRGGTVVGRSGPAVVFASQHLTAVQVARPGYPQVRVIVRDGSAPGLQTARRFWRTLSVQGATLP
jgi:hypothetical protein